MTGTVPHFLLRPDLVIVQPVVLPARAKADCPAGFLRRAREMESRQAVAAVVSFAVRFSPETGLFAVVLFGLCRSPIRFATAGFVPAADPFDPAGFGFAAAAAVVVVAAAAAAAAAVAADLSDPSAADLFVVAGLGSAVFAADLACSVCSFAVALAKGRVVVVPFCFLTRRSSF